YDREHVPSRRGTSPNMAFTAKGTCLTGPATAGGAAAACRLRLNQVERTPLAGRSLESGRASLPWAGVRAQDVAEVVEAEGGWSVRGRVGRREQRTELGCGTATEVVRRSRNERSPFLPLAVPAHRGGREEGVEARPHRRVDTARAWARVG